MSHQVFVLATLLTMILSYFFISTVHGILAAFAEAYSREFKLKKIVNIMMINLATLMAAGSLLFYQWNGKYIAEVAEQAKIFAEVSIHSMADSVSIFTVMVMIVLFTIAMHIVILSLVEFIMSFFLAILIISPIGRLAEKEENQ